MSGERALDGAAVRSALPGPATGDELHDHVLANTADVIAVRTLTGDFTWVSPSVERVLGWRPEQMLGRNVAEFLHPDDRAAVLAIPQQLSGEADQIDVTVRYTRPDGGHTWVEGHVRGIRDTTGRLTGQVATIRDVGERKRLEAELSQALATFETAFTEAPIGMALVGVDGRFLKVNTALCSLLDRTEVQLLAGTFQDITHPDDIGTDLRLLRETLAGARSSYRMEKRYLGPDGGVVWALLAVALVRDAAGAPQFLIAQIEDISERKNALHELEHMATTDVLTRLPNRAILIDRLRHALELARRGDWQVGVLFLDLDGFKQVNDTHGHDVGDALLRQVAERLREAVREGDTVSRLGGDEFVVVCEQVHSSGDASRLAARIEAALARPFDVGDRALEVSASIGITLGSAGDGTAMLRDADNAMYDRKRRRHDGPDPYVQALEGSAAEQLARNAALHAGLERGEIRVHYQPVVALDGRRVVAREALVRWMHPERGLLDPATFLPGAELSPVGIALGEHVLHTACAEAAGWTDATALRVDVSAAQLAAPGFADLTLGCLDDAGLPPDRLVLEITESLVLGASRSTLAAAAVLTGHGVGLCLDDFGTGYSSVSALHRLPIAGFKIDRSFVVGVPAHGPTSGLVDGLISLGLRMGLDVGAAGVEREDQHAWLATRGCRHAQGHLYGGPAPPTGAPDGR